MDLDANRAKRLRRDEKFVKLSQFMTPTQITTMGLDERTVRDHPYITSAYFWPFWIPPTLSA